MDCAGADRRDIRCKNKIDPKERPDQYCDKYRELKWLEENL
jgi:hypothetical protein